MPAHAPRPSVETNGRTLIEIDGSDRQIGLYSPARSIADVFRLRGLEGYEDRGTSGMVASPWFAPSEPMRIAEALPRASAPIHTALEHLS